jgi:hypothetical protein
MQEFASPAEASLDFSLVNDKLDAAAQRCVDHILEEPNAKQACDNDERRVAKTSRRRAKGTTVPAFRGPLNYQFGSRDQSVFTYSVSGDAGQVPEAEGFSRVGQPNASMETKKVDVPTVPHDPQHARPAYLLQPQRGLQTVPQMMRPQQRPQQHEQTQPKGLMQQLAERQAQRTFPGLQTPSQPPILTQPQPNGRMQSTGNSWMYQQYSQHLDMYEGSGYSRGQAAVQMQYTAAMSGMPHPDGMYCGPLGYGQSSGQLQSREQPSVDPASMQPGHHGFPQLMGCQHTRQADMSLSTATTTGIGGGRTETEFGSVDALPSHEDEAQQFRAALRYASQPILSDAKMRSRRAEAEQQCGSDNESLSSQTCVGRTPVKGERAPSPSSDCTASTRELAPTVELSAAGRFGVLGRAATGRCGIYA